MRKVFSIENELTGDYHTYSIEEMSEDSLFAPGRTVLSILVERNKYQGIAFIDDEDGCRVWSRHLGSEFAKMAKFAWHVLMDDPRVPDHYSVVDSVECRRCGELLTRPDSVRKGIGPYCEQQEERY